MTASLDIAVIAGDGIGPEVIEAALPSITAAARAGGAELCWERLPYGADHFLATGETLPRQAVDHLRDDVGATLLGALGDPRVPGNEHARDILLGLRCKLDLYINFRPCGLLHPELCPLKRFATPALAPAALAASAGKPPSEPNDASRENPSIDFVIFRENTEGSYLGRGRSKHVGTPTEEQIAEEVHTAPKVGRIIHAAFEWASANGKTRVTMSDKSNAVPAHKLWQRLFDEVGSGYPRIEREHRYVDALAMELVRNPEHFQVIVTSNLLGDILSDLGAQLVGGLGLAASANLHPGQAGLFEPVHGSAPPLAGKGVANPMATMLSAALMLGELGIAEGACLLEEGVRSAILAGVRTPDISGTRTTQEVGQWIEEWIINQ
jgi:3-isopropylmalate dehydrogenase